MNQSHRFEVLQPDDSKDVEATSGIQSVCLFCGAAAGHDPIYAQSLAQFAKGLAERDMTLITGGGGVGLMGAAADAMLAAGGKAIGIIPARLLQSEIGHKGMSELHIVESMHERKALMGQMADAFVAGPGGIGTFEELFEVFTWKQIGYHDKPVLLLNIAHYYDPMIVLLDHCVKHGLLQAKVRDMLKIFDTPQAALDYLASIQPHLTVAFKADAT